MRCTPSTLWSAQVRAAAATAAAATATAAACAASACCTAVLAHVVNGIQPAVVTGSPCAYHVGQKWSVNHVLHNVITCYNMCYIVCCNR
jgi:hypothetical protein